MVQIRQFFNNDYITFAGYDNSRKIPSIVDGFKTSQRKIIYTILKNNIDSELKEVKVEQLAAKASEQTSYLHGSVSLSGVTVGLATKYTGSNNINLLEPDGNFGTRFIRDASAPRYIYTYLSDISKSIICKEDDPILEDQTFEGQTIEPKTYYPIIPMVLVNGAEGLSVGFASKIYSRDPKQIIKWLKHKLKTGNSLKYDFLPYFKGFKGTIEASTENNKIKYTIKGDYKVDSVAQLTITELPIKYTLQSYIKVLDTLCDKNIIKSYRDLSDQDQFQFEIKVRREFFDNKSKDDILQTLKLVETVYDNLVLLDEVGKIHEYTSILDILEHYYSVRLVAYEHRLQHQLLELQKDLQIQEAKKTFIEGVLDNQITIKENLEIVTQQIKSLNLPEINGSYDYLLDMKISSLTKERVLALSKKITELKTLKSEKELLTAFDLWLADLEVLEKQL